MDGIESVRAGLAKTYIDETKCKPLIKALENYRREYDTEKKIYKAHPLHDQYSHACFVGETLISTDKGQVPIRDMKPGMKVKTPLGFREVLNVHERTANDLIDINVGNINITCTPEHSIFTQRGMVSADALRYTDILEYNSKLSGYIWQKIYGYYGKACDLKGFKKNISSLKTETMSSLMGTFIAGMDIIIDQDKQSSVKQDHYIERCGCSTMDQYQEVTTFITLTSILETMRSAIYNAFQQKNMEYCMARALEVGHNQMNVRSNSNRSMQKQLNGIEVKWDENGIETMQRIHCQAYAEQDIQKHAKFAQNNIKANRHGNDSVLMRVKRSIASSINSILRIGIVASVKLYSIAINTLLRKHAVKTVRSYSVEQPKVVFDLTIDVDNCYYANGYLVSNCDAARYLFVSVGKTKDGLGPEELERRYQQAMSGNYLPHMFRDDYMPF